MSKVAVLLGLVVLLVVAARQGPEKKVDLPRVSSLNK